MIKPSQQHRQVTNFYELVLDISQNILTINLRNNAKVFRKIFLNQCLPHEFSNYFTNTYSLYSVLRNDQNYEVDQQKGKIKVKTFSNCLNDEIEEEIIELDLEEVVMERWQLMQRQLVDIKHRVVALQWRQRQDNENNLRKMLKIQRMQQENKSLKIQIQKLNSKIQDNVNIYNSYAYNVGQPKENHYENNLTLSQEHNINFSQSLNKKCKIQEQKYLCQNQKMQEKFQQILHNWKNFERFYKQQHSQIKSNFYSLKDSIPLLSDLYLNTPSFSKFKIKGRVIKFDGQDNKITSISMRKPISRQHIQRFSCKIIKSQYRYIAIGVMNRNPHFHDALESVCYWGYGGGFLSYSKGKYKEEGGGFTEGETVMAQINLKQGIIQWIVNSKQRCSIKLPFLKNPHLQLYPCIDFCNSGDCIQWLQ